MSIKEQESKIKILASNNAFVIEELDAANHTILKNDRIIATQKAKYINLETEFNKNFIEMKSIELKNLTIFVILFLSPLNFLFPILCLSIF